MECESYVENGRGRFEPAVREVRAGWSRGEHQFGAGGASLWLADRPAAVGAPGGFAVHLAMGTASKAHTTAPVTHSVQANTPFMNTMDEISYWICTKRAPCLMNYDSVKKPNEQAQCSKSKPKSVPSVAEVPSPKKKKKRKLSLLDEDSGSGDKHQNIYFDTSQKHKETLISSCKSDTLGSDLDFNIKNDSVQGKPKRPKHHKNNRTTLHKKNKVVTSTPKVSNLRRSLRQAQQSLNNNTQLNSSFEIYHHSVINGRYSGIEHKSPDKLKKSSELLAGGDQTVDSKKNSDLNKFNKSHNDILNGQFEDLSDVSGFTANYIRSTKLQSTKTPKKLRCKNNRNLVKESRQSLQKDNTMVLCVNKSVNTGIPKSSAMNCSTESENVVNLITKDNSRSAKVSKSTSLLKFLDSKSTKSVKEPVANKKQESGRTRTKAHLNVSFQSQTSTSRYPKRYRNQTISDYAEEIPENANQVDKKRKISKNSSDFNNSDRKENPEAITMISRTRSGKSIGLTLRQPENSVLVLSNSTEQVSSMVSMNVASLSTEQKDKLKKKKRITRHLRSKKALDKQTSVQRDSLRDKSGFAACFSDSDDDSEPLKQRKFFCA